MNGLTVLVVDDEAAIRQILVEAIARAGYVVESADDGLAALQRLRHGDIDIAICDLKMPNCDGIELVRSARESGIETTFLMMTAYASVSTAIDAMRAGAYDYMIKPLRNEDVLRRLEQIANVIELSRENQTLRSIVLGSGEEFCQFESEAMRRIDRLVAKVAPTDSNVLVTGESGTGKGVISRAIHNMSPRRNWVFLPVNCGAIPDNLLESEFFGHLKGAFTGAERAKKGLFAEADKGTIFLDEVGELPLPMQVKLLHVLEDQEIRAVGSERARKVDVRIIAATNRDLEREVERGRFRQDLYFRLNVMRIDIPPLRERREDIRNLFNFFLARHARENDLERSYTLDPLAEQILLQYDWPGNARELENVIERAHILAEGEQIGIADLPPQLLSDESAGEQAAAGTSLREQVRNFETHVILGAIEEAGGDRRLAARRLGIGLSTLYRKLEETVPEAVD